MLLGACPCQPAILAILMGLCTLQEAEDIAEPPQGHLPGAWLETGRPHVTKDGPWLKAVLHPEG